MKFFCRLVACLLAAGGMTLALPGFEVRGPYGGDVRSLAISPHAPNVLLAGSADGQIFRSPDSGEHWERTAGVGRGWVVDNLVFDPAKAGRVYAATWDLGGSGGGLYRSDDNGYTWNNLRVVDRPISIRALSLADEGRTVVVGALDGVHVSRDSGATWSLISEGQVDLINVESVAVDPGDSRTIYAGTWHLGAKTTDGGATWTWVKQGMADDSDLFSIAIHPAKTAVVYASACSGIYKSNDGGKLWLRLGNGLPAEAKRTRSIYIDPVNRDRIYAGTTQGLYRSTDAGASWKRISAADLTINGIVVNPRNEAEVFLATDDAGVMKSTDGGATFQQSNTGFTHRNVAQIVSDPAQDRRLYASVLFDRAYGGFFISEDGGATWAQSNAGLPADTDIYSILPSARGTTILIGTSSGIYVSAARNQKWTKLAPATGSPLAAKLAQLKVLQLRFFSSDEGSLVAATTGGIYLGDLKTRKWTRPVMPQYNGDIYGMHVDSEQKALFAASRVGLFVSRDSGKAWTLASGGLPMTAIHSIERMPQQGILVVGTGHGIYRSQDDGQNWTAITAGIPPVDISVLAKSGDGRSLYAADFVQGNVYESRDLGLTWLALTRGMNSGISTLAVNMSHGSELLLGSRSDGIYFLRAQPTAAVVEARHTSN